MTITRPDLFRRDLFTDLFEDMNLRLESLFNTVNTDEPCCFGASDFSYPRIDIDVTDEAYIIKAAVPGFDLSELETKIKQDNEETVPVLTISGKKTTETSEQSGKRVIHQIRQSQFEKPILLPRGAYDKVEASLKNGILTIRVPIPEKQKPKEAKIAIN